MCVTRRQQTSPWRPRAGTDGRAVARGGRCSGESRTQLRPELISPYRRNAVGGQTRNPIPAIPKTAWGQAIFEPPPYTRKARDGSFDKIINYTRNVIIRTQGDYFSQTKAASGLNRSIGCGGILCFACLKGEGHRP